MNSPRIRLSQSENIIIDNRDTKESIVDFVCALKRKNTDFPIFTLPFWMQLKFHLNLLSTRMPKRKTEELGSLSKSEKVSINRLYSRVRAAYGSVQNLSKVSGLSKKKVEQVLPTKTSYTKFGPPIRRFQRLQVFSKPINETWCMDLAFVDKLASQNNGVKFSLVAVDVFSRFVRVQTMKTKYAEDTLQAFKKMISRKNTPEKLWIDKGTEYGGTFKKFCEEKNIEVYSLMNETKAAFAERAIQSLKHLIYRYIEDHGKKFIHKLPQFVSTMNCRINRSIGDHLKMSRILISSQFCTIKF